MAMVRQQARAIWRGDIKHGSGTLRSANFEGGYSYGSRFDGQAGATPEELIGAAHAGCFSMALSLMLGKRGLAPEVIRTTATVEIDEPRLEITGIELETEAEVPGMDEAAFRAVAEQAKAGCPVSKALASVPIVLRSARLVRVPVAPTRVTV
jgi:osmotically inducible protein OsmC